MEEAKLAEVQVGEAQASNGGDPTEPRNDAGQEEAQRPETAPDMPPQEEALPQPPVAPANADPHEQVHGAHLDKPSAVAHPAAGQSSGVTQSGAKAAQKIEVQS